MNNTGKDYEIFVANLQQAILNSEIVLEQKNITVELNKLIQDNFGINRQFDIYWEYELGGISYKTVIECKDYNRSVSIEKIDALIGKIRDIPDLKAVFATKNGYQSGAKLKAQQNKIDLLVVREQNDSDWIDESGNPLIKSLFMNSSIRMPARILNFVPFLDKKWVKANTSIDTSVPLDLYGRTDEIIIENIQTNETSSLQDISNGLSPIGENRSGFFKKTEKLNDAFLIHKDLKLKIHGYKIEYSISKPFEMQNEIDFSKELIGVVEYLQKGTKKTVFRDGRVL